MNNEFKRKTKEEKPVIAICYDFDKTLSPDDMQAQGFIQSVGYDVAEFWKESNQLAQDNDMDQNLAYMYTMMDKAEGNVLFNKKTLIDYGKKVELFDGVESWFERINKYGKENDILIEHYIISSGLKEMIEGTSIAKYFEKIYASSFYCNAKGTVKWPAQVINYTNKTQFLFRIEKGVLDINDPAVNDYIKPEDIRIPFRNIIYIGDSDTDIPCMKLVNVNGGHSIGVFNPNTNDKAKVHKMMRENRVKYFAPANYTKNSELDNLVKSIIERTAANEVLEAQFNRYKQEAMEKETADKEDSRLKVDTIMKLSNSRNFMTTHTVVKELSAFLNWEREEMNALFEIALENTQVSAILKDKDIKIFYSKLLKQNSEHSSDALKVKEILESKE